MTICGAAGRFEAARYLNSSSVRVLAAHHRLQDGRVPHAARKTN